MSDVYGQGAYGERNRAGSMAAGMSNPWVGLAQFLVGRAAENYTGMGDAYDTNKQITAGGKDINAEHNSPFGVADKMGADMMPGAEKMLAVNWKPMAVGEATYNMGPTTGEGIYNDVYKNYYTGGGYRF